MPGRHPGQAAIKTAAWWPPYPGLAGDHPEALNDGGQLVGFFLALPKLTQSMREATTKERCRYEGLGETGVLPHFGLVRSLVTFVQPKHSMCEMGATLEKAGAQTMHVHISVH